MQRLLNDGARYNPSMIVDRHNASRVEVRWNIADSRRVARLALRISKSGDQEIRVMCQTKRPRQKELVAGV